jgi:4-diphosphocytidyl-2C-methyl-D-erythritol kinase
MTKEQSVWEITQATQDIIDNARELLKHRLSFLNFHNYLDNLEDAIKRFDANVDAEEQGKSYSQIVLESMLTGAGATIVDVTQDKEKP